MTASVPSGNASAEPSEATVESSGGELRFVVVVSPGRSGSTLTQGLLNALPRTLIRGENNFFFLPIFRANGRIANYARRFGADAHKPTSAHYGVDQFDLDAFAAVLRQWSVDSLLGDVPSADVDVTGFKEVRWDELRPGETPAFFAWFERVFPGVQYVLNRRDPSVAIHSGHYREVSEEAALKAFRRIFEVQDFLAESRAGRTFSTGFEVLTGPDEAAKEDQLRGLAEFVHGSCDAELLDDLKQVLTVGHGPFPFGRARGGRVVRG